MLKSMTGYGRSVRESDGKRITAEIKAVNHRFFECAVRTPRGYSFLEEAVRSRVGERVKRGKTEIGIAIENLGDDPVEVSYNHVYLTGWLASLKNIGRAHKLKNDLTLSDIAANREIFIARKPEEDQEALAAAVLAVVDEATQAFLAAREKEGARLVADITRRLDTIAGHVDAIDARSPQTVREYREKLLVRMKEALGSVTVDETRLLTEAAIYADKVTVAEETTRLRTHIDNFRSLLAGNGPIGKKLDFYMQEMNREINTTGSKCNDVEMARVVIEVKSELENIREQIQNIE